MPEIAILTLFFRRDIACYVYRRRAYRRTVWQLGEDEVWRDGLGEA
jgi:hypothetical protein